MTLENQTITKQLELSNTGLNILSCIPGYITDINNKSVSIRLNDRSTDIEYEAEMDKKYFAHELYRIGTVFNLYIGEIDKLKPFLYIEYPSDIYQQEELDKADARGKKLSLNLRVI